MAVRRDQCVARPDVRARNSEDSGSCHYNLISNNGTSFISGQRTKLLSVRRISGITVSDARDGTSKRVIVDVWKLVAGGWLALATSQQKSRKSRSDELIAG